MPDVLAARLGKTVSPFAFGVMQFGGKADAAQSEAMYLACRAAGITMFDAAYVYTEGRAETLLGQFAESERDDVILISKCAHQPRLEFVVAEDLTIRRLRFTDTVKQELDSGHEDPVVHPDR